MPVSSTSKTKVPEFTIKEMRDFAEPKSQEFANVLAGDAATAREQLRKRITKLVLMDPSKRRTVPFLR